MKVCLSHYTKCNEIPKKTTLQNRCQLESDQTFKSHETPYALNHVVFSFADVPIQDF